ncbi:hypothetical protein MLD38_025532 [Melastoma candidum]|uniref:Uncharacterized protein n=1 Tax=Melastoma candidum TaxID=119954 RepID=A0ACB9NVR5_9MYRT|nr:hypothetical protein MLD38_025532 [Melastoma candidum]
MNSKSQTPYQIFLQSQSLTLALAPIQTTTLSRLKSSLFPSIPSSCYFTLNGKPLDDSTQLLPSLDDSTHLLPSLVPPFSTLVLACRLLGGGRDGGATGAESRDYYLNMYAVKKPDKVDPNEQRLSKWLNCALSGEPLTEPCKKHDEVLQGMLD